MGGFLEIGTRKVGSGIGNEKKRRKKKKRVRIGKEEERKTER